MRMFDLEAVRVSSQGTTPTPQYLPDVIRGLTRSCMTETSHKRRAAKVPAVKDFRLGACKVDFTWATHI